MCTHTHIYSKILINYRFLIFGLRFMAVRMNLFALHSISLPLYSSMLSESGRSVFASFQYCLLTFNIFCFFFILLTKLHWWKLTCKVDSPVCTKQDWNPIIPSGNHQITFFKKHFCSNCCLGSDWIFLPFLHVVQETSFCSIVYITAFSLDYVCIVVTFSALIILRLVLCFSAF